MKCYKICLLGDTLALLLWNALILYCVLQAITKFESLANQIQKNAGDIDERLHMIESVRLFKQPPPKPGGELPEAKVSMMGSFSYMQSVWDLRTNK